MNSLFIPLQVLLLVAIIYIAIFVLGIIGQWKIFSKAGLRPWAVFVPFYNLYSLFKLVWSSGWKFLLTFIPCIGVVVYFATLYRIPRAFGKSKFCGVMCALFSPVVYFYLGVSKCTYRKVAFRVHVAAYVLGSIITALLMFIYGAFLYFNVVSVRAVSGMDTSIYADSEGNIDGAVGGYSQETWSYVTLSNSEVGVNVPAYLDEDTIISSSELVYNFSDMIVNMSLDKYRLATADDLINRELEAISSEDDYVEQTRSVDEEGSAGLAVATYTYGGDMIIYIVKVEDVGNDNFVTTTIDNINDALTPQEDFLELLGYLGIEVSN